MAAITAMILGGGAGAGASVYQGEQQRRAARQGLRAQEEAQRMAMAAAISQRRTAEQEQARVNRKKPDITALLAAEQLGATRTGISSTQLTGGLGKLGATSMLGEPTK